jgi:two-component system, NarL family, response regulator DevR
MIMLVDEWNTYTRVVIVDDSLIIRERLAEMVNNLEGVELIGEARNVSEAIDAINALQPEVVILDLQMPGGSGLDVLQNMKESEDTPVIIMLTNYAFPGFRQRCLKAGADYFLDKSTEFDQIPELLTGCATRERR